LIINEIACKVTKKNAIIQLFIDIFLSADYTTSLCALRHAKTASITPWHDVMLTRRGMTDYNGHASGGRLEAPNEVNGGAILTEKKGN
jgi:hypothetical protein